MYGHISFGCPESDLVMTKLGPVKDYLPVKVPLLDFLTVKTEGPTGWKYLKLQELRKFQQKRGLTYSILDDVEVEKLSVEYLQQRRFRNSSNGLRRSTGRSRISLTAELSQWT